jgi:polyketide biosynthesis acyl carrier protein
MTQSSILEIVKTAIRSVLPTVDMDRITMDTRLGDLGADSVDRSDILIGSMDAVGVSLPLVELGKTNSIGALVTLLHQWQRR